MQRLIREEVVGIINVCPEITNREIHRMAKVVVRERVLEDIQAFRVKVQWSAGEEREVVTISPGEERQMLKFAADQFAKEYRHRGLVVYDPTREDRDEAVLRGLMAAYQFFKENGSDALTRNRMRGGFRDDEFERFREQYRAYWINEAKERVLWERIKEVREEMGDPIPSEEDEVAARDAVVRVSGSDEEIESLRQQLAEEVAAVKALREDLEERLTAPAPEPQPGAEEGSGDGTSAEGVGA